jgi:hypothetical protein
MLHPVRARVPGGLAHRPAGDRLQQYGLHLERSDLTLDQWQRRRNLLQQG